MQPFSRPLSAWFATAVVAAVSLFSLNRAARAQTYTLTVQSTPPTGVSISSVAGYGGTTNYSVTGIASGTSVDLTAPAMDPTGTYAFLEWTLNGLPYSPGQNSITLTISADEIAVAEYFTCTLNVQSTPVIGMSIGSSTGDGGTTNYSVTGILSAQTVNLVAPATDPSGYSFSQWTINGQSQTFGQKAVTFSAPASFLTWGSYGNGSGQLYYPLAIALAGSGNVYVADSYNHRIQEFTSTGAYVTQWGSYGSGNGQLYYPSSIAVDNAGNVYVADTYNHRIQEFTFGGQYVTQWGGYGSGNGQLDYPNGIALDSAGNVYVADTYNHRIQEFTSAGAYVTQWGGYGSGNGQFYYPNSVALNSAGHVCVADTYNHRIQEFTSAGVYVTQWGGYGSGNGQFSYPEGIAADSAGNVYVADRSNYRIQEFTSAGAYVTQWGSNGSGNGQFYLPWGVAVDSAGNVYVADTYNQRIQVFVKNILAVAGYAPVNTLSVQSTPPTGLSIASTTGDAGTTNYSMTGITSGQSVNLQAPATDPTTGYTFSQWMVNGVAQAAGQQAITFTTTGAATTAVAQYALTTYTLNVQSAPQTGLSIGSSSGHGGTTNYTLPGVAYGTSVNLQVPATDPAGYTFEQWALNGTPQVIGQKSITFAVPAATTAVAQYSTCTLNVQSTPPVGILIGSSTGCGGTTDYSVPGMISGQNVNLAAPATDPSGYVFSQWTINGQSQTFGQKAVTFSAPAGFLTWGSYEGGGSGQFQDPYALAVAGSGNVYVADTNNHRIQEFTSAGAYVTQWGSYGSGNGQFNSPEGIAADSAGNVYVADTDNNRIQVFTFGGQYVTQWGSAGSDNGQFNSPRGVAVDSSGNVYVADTGNSRIEQFTSAGAYVTQWGGYGSGNGQFYYAESIAADSAGNVYVADPDYPRIQKFTSGGAYLTQWGSYGPGNAQLEYPYGIAVDGSGNVYVADTDNHRIEQFTSAGAYVTQWGTLGSGNGQFYYPEGVAVDSEGNVYVADTDNNRIQVFEQNLLAVAVYAPVNTLSVQSTPPTGLSIGSTTGDAGTTNYSVTGITSGQSVNLQAPATDPTTGYTFSQWMVNGVAQAAGQQAITFTTTGAATTAVAQYALTTYTLNVQSTPPTGLGIGSSSGHDGTTNYTVPGVTYGANVNLAAPATDPAGYTFEQWALNGTPQVAGQKSVSFIMTATTTAVAQYSTYTLNVQSTPPTGLSITSGTGDGGTTNYSVTGILPAQTVNLVAPATDPAGYIFSQWTINGQSQTFGQKAVTFAAPAGFLTWGSYGNESGQFYYPYSVAVAGSGNIYVADTFNHRIQEFTSAGAYVTQWGSYGSGNGQFYYPEGVAVDSEGNVYVADTDNNRIQVFTFGGQYVTQWGGYGSGDGQFESPQGIAVNNAGNVYVADTNNGRIQEFTSAGVYLTQWGGYGQGNGQFYYPNGIALDSAGNVYVADTYNHRIQEFTSAGAYVTQWGGYGHGNGQFYFPYGIGVDSEGNVYVADTYNSRIQEFTSAGAYVTQWGGYGSGNGQFYLPYGIGVDSEGNVYLADTYNQRIQVFGENLLAVAVYTPVNTLSVQSTPPTGLSIASTTGDAGTTNYAVSGVTTGTSVNLQAPATDPTIGYTFSQWMVNGVAQTAGQQAITFTTTAAATTAVAQYALTAYTLNVQSAPLTGVGIGSISGHGGTTNYTVSSVAYGTNVNLQVPATDPAGYTFEQWTLNGTPQVAGQKSISFIMTATTTAVAQYSTYTLNVQSTPPTGLSITSGTGDGGTTNYSVTGILPAQTVNLVAPATDPAGYIFSQWTINGQSQTFGQKAVTFAAPASFLTWGSYGNESGQFYFPQALAVAGSGNVYVADTNNHRIQEFTSTGAYVTQWGSYGTDNGQFEYIYGIALDSAGNVYVTDLYNRCIQKFTFDGQYVTQWGGAGNGNGQFVNPEGIALDSAGNVYVADTNNHRIQEFTSAGDYITQWGGYGAGNGQLYFPNGIALDSAGNVYVADTYNHRIQEFTSAGVYVTQWGSYGSGNGQFCYPEGIAVDGTGNVYVADTDNHRIEEFTSAGAYLTQWGSYGSGNGQFCNPEGIAVDSEGNVYVADTDNNRIQVFVKNILAVAVYAPVNTLSVQSTPPTGLSIGSSTGDAGTTNYVVPGLLAGTSVNLQAPATDPAGYAFSQWTVNGTAQTAGLKTITFTMTEATTAVAGYLIPSTVSVVSCSGIPGGTLTVPINLNAQGNENSLGFSLNWDTTVLTYVSCALGSNDAGCTWTKDETQTGTGKVGITISQPSGLMFSSGTKQILLVTFSIKSGWVGTTSIPFGNTPNPEGVSDVNGNPLTASWQGAQVEGGLEGDVKLNGTVNAPDWTTIGRIIVGLAPAPTGLAFQAADCAPRATLGNSSINAGSWTQCGRYVVGLDPRAAIGGPFAPAGMLDLESTTPAIAITSSTGHCGTTNCTMSGIASGTSVNLQVPATDPAGYTFSQWVVNGVLQSAGQKSITFTMSAGTRAVAQYTTTAAH